MYYELQKMYYKYRMCITDYVLQLQKLYYIYVIYRYPGLIRDLNPGPTFTKYITKGISF